MPLTTHFSGLFRKALVILPLLAASACSGGALTNSVPPSSAGTTAQQNSINTLSQTAPRVAPPDYDSLILGDAPFSYYRLNDVSGPTAVDASGHSHNGSFTTGVLLNQPALVWGDSSEKSANFAKGYASESATWTQQVVTAEVWIKPTTADVAGWPRVLGNAWADHSGNGYMLWLSAGVPAFNAGYMHLEGTSKLAAGHIYHLVGTFSVSEGARLFVNGQLVATHATYGAIPHPQTGDSTMTYVGVLQTGAQFGLTDYFQGDISDVAIYDKVLSQTQIDRHYIAGTHGPAPAVTPSPPSSSPTPIPVESYVHSVAANSPLALYRLADSAGTIAVDSSGNSKNGSYVGKVTLNGAPLLRSDQAKSASFPSGYAVMHLAWTTPAVTAEAWIKPTAADLSGSPRIVSNAWTDHNGKGFMLWLNGGTAVFSTGFNSVSGTTALAPGQTYHVVGTYTRAEGLTIYVNGRAQRNTPTGGYTPTPQIGYPNATYIGTLNAVASDANYGLTDYFQGGVADVAIYDHALTPQDVANHYNVGAVANVVPIPIPTIAPSPPPPVPTSAPAKLSYNAVNACINHGLYKNDVLPAGEGEFGTKGLDRTYWGRTRGNPIGGNQHSGFSLSWGRNQYDTYFGDKNDGVSTASDDPFYVGHDAGAPGSPTALRIKAFPMPAHLVGNPAVGGAHYYSGTLDTPVNLQYGFFVARVRTPAPKPGLSPAFWMLTNNGTPQGPHGPLNGEWDVQEMFANDYGDGMNAGNALWNSAASGVQNWGGVFDWPPTGIPESSTPSSDYHDYGVLLSPGGAVISANDYGPGGPGLTYGPTFAGATNYLDGIPLYGHTGGADMTSGVSWKELMAMFQVAAQGSWLGSPNPADFPSSYWIQWIRVYRPTSTSC